jgi:hypothetical protein
VPGGIVNATGTDTRFNSNFFVPDSFNSLNQCPNRLSLRDDSVEIAHDYRDLREDLRPDDLRPEDFRPDDFFADDLRAEDFRPEDLRPPDDLRAPDDFLLAGFRGTLPPAARASDNPIAIACFRLVTFRPFPRPVLSVPDFFRRIADATFLLAVFPYFLPPDDFRAAIVTNPRVRVGCAVYAAMFLAVARQ